MIIRPGNKDDIEELIELGRRMHEESAYAFLPFDSGKVRRWMHHIADHPETHCGIVAEHEGRIRGMIGGFLTDYFFCDEKVACDMILFMDPAYRGGAAAARLIRAFEQWAAARGARELCLSVSTGVNAEVVGRLYRTLGFTQVGGVFKLRL